MLLIEATNQFYKTLTKEIKTFVEPPYIPIIDCHQEPILWNFARNDLSVFMSVTELFIRKKHAYYSS